MKTMDALDVVLVHGLYHQPAHMRLLAEELIGRGAVTHVPPLHRGSLESDTRAVQDVVDSCERPPILVGHSYGGAVITGIRGASALLFVAAFVPDIDESCASLGGRDAPVNAWVRPHPDGGTYVPVEVAPSIFYGDCDTATAHHAARLLRRQAHGHGRGNPAVAGWKSTETRYMVCSADRAMEPQLQRRLAERCDSSIEISASHSPYLSMPSVVADFVLEQR